MKPHEEEWTAACPETDENMGPSVGLWANEEVLFGEIYTQEGDRTALVLAAPNMAQALLSVLKREPGSDLRFTLGKGILDDIRAALTKAGVLP